MGTGFFRRCFSCRSDFVSLLTKNLIRFHLIRLCYLSMGRLLARMAQPQGVLWFVGKSPATNSSAESNIGGFGGLNFARLVMMDCGSQEEAQSPGILAFKKAGSKVRMRRLFGQGYLRSAGNCPRRSGHQRRKSCSDRRGGREWSFVLIDLLWPWTYGGPHGAWCGDGCKKSQGSCRVWKKKIQVTEQYALLCSEANRTLKQDNEAKIMHETGSAGVANYAEYLGSMPSTSIIRVRLKVLIIFLVQDGWKYFGGLQRLSGMCDRLRACGQFLGWSKA